MKLPSSIRVREVSPRDGLQGERVQLSTEDKVRLVDMLSAAGFTQINVTSFVSPKRVPNMADAAEVMTRIERRPGIVYDATVPNVVGAERAVDAGADAVVAFVAASEEANRSNVGRSTAAALQQAEQVIEVARDAGLLAIGTVACAFGSPYGEQIESDDVLGIAGRLVDAGASAVALGDTSGEGTPSQVHRLVTVLRAKLPPVEISLHLHDTRGLALANAIAAMDAGATSFDGAVGGIGGSAFTKDSAGNLATDDLVDMCDRMGISTGVDPAAVHDVYNFLTQKLGHPLSSRVGELRQSSEVGS